MDIIENKLKNGIFKEYGPLKYAKIIKLFYTYKLIKETRDLNEFVSAIFEKIKKDSDVKFDYECIDYDKFRKEMNAFSSLMNCQSSVAGTCSKENLVSVYTTSEALKSLELDADLISVGLLITIFHEIEHVIQHQNEELNLQTYRMKKESYIQKKEAEKFKDKTNVSKEKNYYIEKHDFFEFEIDANLKSALKVYNFLEEYDNCYKEFYWFLESTIKHFLTQRGKQEYKDIEKKFDNIIDNNEYPFNLEYDSNGNRLSIEQVLNNDVEDIKLYNHIIYNTFTNLSSEEQLKVINKNNESIIKEALLMERKRESIQEEINDYYLNKNNKDNKSKFMIKKHNSK